MASNEEKRLREERAQRLVWARKRAEYSGPTAVANKLGININSYKAYEQGRNGFGLDDARKFAALFNVSLQWLNYGTGNPDDDDIPAETAFVHAPLISWVSAGALLQPDTVTHFDDEPMVYAPDLDPSGDWVALRVDGDSMNRISPHDSIIFVNRNDKRLVPNACYVIGDGNGGATYKRFRPPNRWEPVSTNEEHKPFVLPVGVEPDIIGRVRKTILSM